MGIWGDERNRTLTSIQQTSDKLFPRPSLPAHLVCISLRLPSSPWPLSLVCLIFMSHTSPGLHPAQPGTEQKSVRVPA